MRFVKGLLYVSVALIVLIAASATYITQVLDPNDLKPTIADAAAAQQIELSIDGPIEWSFYPWLGLSAEQVSASTPQGDLTADRLEATISLLSVFTETFVVDRLTAVQPVITRRDQPSQATSQRMVESTGAQPPVVVRSIAISDGLIRGLPNQTELQQLNISLETLSPDTESRLDAETVIAQNDVRIPIALSAEITPTANFDSLTAQKIEITSRSLDATFDGFVSIALSGSAAAEGNLTLNEFSPRQWLKSANLPILQTASLTALDRVRLNTDLKLSEDQISLNPLDFTLDQSEFTGAVDINLSPLSVQFSGELDALTLDDYIQTAQPTADDAKATEVPEALLLPGSYQLQIGQLTVYDVPMDNFQMELGVQTDEVTVSRVQAEVFDGTVTASGNHLLAPQISNLNGTIDAVEVNRLPLTGPINKLSGTLSGAFDLRAAGHTVELVTSSLTGPLRLKLADGRLGKLNIAEATCQALGQTATTAPPTADTASIRLQFREGVAQIESLNSQIANLTITGSGRFSVMSTGINLQGDILIPSDGQLGLCQAPVEIRGLQLPFQCRGQFNQSSMRCGLDEARIREALGRAVEERVKTEAKKAVQQRLNEALKDQLEGQTNGLLRNLIGQ
jgi:AsmA protein